MKTKSVWMFAGQGSQYYRMGRELFEKEPVFRREVERADEILRDLTGTSLIDVIYGPRADRSVPFRRVLHSSPAIVAVECAVAKLLLDRGLRPDYLLGHSLGELACMVVAGVVSFDDAIVTIVKYSELLEYCAPPGGMLAVLDSPDLMHRHPGEFEGCEMVGLNFDRNFLVAGLAEPLSRLQSFLKTKGILTAELPVAYAFHTRWTDVIVTPGRALLGLIPKALPQFPIVSAALGGTAPDCSGEHLWYAMRASMDFARTIAGLEKDGPAQYIDAGPSGSMATSVKYNLARGSASTFSAVMTPFGQDSKNLDKLMSAGRG